MRKSPSQNAKIHFIIFDDTIIFQNNAQQNVRRDVLIQKVYRNLSITAFVSRDSKHKNAPIFTDTKHSRKSENKSPKQNTLFITRSDAIRNEHDRGRKRSFKQLTIDAKTRKKRRT